MSGSQRSRVLGLYKELAWLGREYPKGRQWFLSRLHGAFARNAQETDPDKVEELLKRGEFVKKEIEALYSLRKYRAMKRNYYDLPPPAKEPAPGPTDQAAKTP